MISKNNPRRALSLLLKAATAVCAFLAIWLCAHGDVDSFMSGPSMFMYFTVQSNILMGVIAAIGAVKVLLGSKGRVWDIIRLTGTVSITLTGMVFCFLLAPVLGSSAWDPSSVLAHVVVPLTSAVDFLLEGSTASYRKRDCVWGIVPPLLYAFYAGAAFVFGWQFGDGKCYPYFFLNWGSPAGAFGFTSEEPYMGCMWWILVLLLFLLAVTSVYILLDRKLHHRRDLKGNTAV